MRRRGVSILEVIFAILVTTVGLLAALTVFPVAAHLARKGHIADQSAISGRAAVHIFDAKGYRRPDMWLLWDPTPPSPSFIPAPVYPNQSYCIDPRFVANGNYGTTGTLVAAGYFPYIPAAASEPRMSRITLTNGVPNIVPGWAPMGLAQANAIFTFGDDNTVNRPSDGSLPAFGSFTQVDHDNDGLAGTPYISTVRSTGGHLSWLATLVPKHELYAAPAFVINDQYVLSIVVFHDRPLLNLGIDTPTSEMYLTSERVVGVNFADAGGLGFAGGETLLIWPPDGTTIPANQANFDFSKEMLKVRAGDWIMLAGNAVHFGGATVPVFRWYRVTEADHEPAYHLADQHYEVAVSLAGQDWDTNLLNQRAFLITGVVGVYEKTVRLETGTGF